MVAVACLLHAIHLVDDLLDEDPSGFHHQIGAGPAANLAAAFQGLAIAVVGQADLDDRRRAAAQRWAGRAILGTASGQAFDARPRAELSEAACRQAVESKTPPLFAAALALGALCGRGDPATAAEIAQLGVPVGWLVQAGDDLGDALTTPAAPDWGSRWNNLAILFGLLTDHPEQDALSALVEEIRPGESSPALREAQEILVRCGAAAYCCHQAVEAYRRGHHILPALELTDPAPLRSLLDRLILPTRSLFEEHGLPLPEGLAAA
jgi:geranylgeranyl pyrophosphate synthase